MSVARQAYITEAAKASRDQMVIDHIGLVRHVLSKLVVSLPDGVDVENLESAGILGLVQAANHFDQDRGVAFRTFAYARIRGAILDELRRNSPLPQRVLENIASVRRTSERLGPEATVESIVAASELSLDEVEEALEAIRLSNAQLPHDPSMILSGITDPRHDRPDAPIEAAELKEVLAECIEALAENERLALTLYYYEDLRLKEIGELLSLSESRICRILAKAEFHLNQQIRKRLN